MKGKARKATARPPGGIRATLMAALLTACISLAAVAFFRHNGSLLYFGDAEAHLNIARRLVDSRTPGYEQLGSPWLPLPHLLMLPFVGSVRLWQSGLAAAISSPACFVLAAAFLFAATRRVFGSTGAAAVATALFVGNPNALYLQSTAMTEAVFFAALMGLLYFSVVFQQTGSWWAVAGAGVAAVAGTLTRYEAWVLLPFTALFFFLAAPDRKLRVVVLFCAIAAVGPALWIGYNWWIFDNPLEFYNGPNSAMGIQAGRGYPGHGDWRITLQYFGSAAKLVLGTPLFWMGFVALAACAVRFQRTWWPVLLLALPPLFYVWQLHSGASPIFIPELEPHGWYNTRYGLALLPFAAFTCAGMAALLPGSLRVIAVATLVTLGAGQWLLFPRPASWITWKESQVNSEARRAWSDEAAGYLLAHYKKGEAIYTNFGDMTGIFRRAGIPLKYTLTGDNGPLFNAAVVRPDLFLWTTWAVVTAGSTEQTAIDKAGLHGPKYLLQREIAVTGAPVIQIYKRALTAQRFDR